jgi:hypothetical protein
MPGHCGGRAFRYAVASARIFMSSTFNDLKPERSAAIQALLELDGIPAGMEVG